MPRWQRPELPEGPLQTLNEELHRLHAFSGHRSSYKIAGWLKARAANDPDFPEDWTTPSHTSIHRVLGSSELPSRPTMISVVEAFIALGSISHGREVLDNVDRLWTAAYEDARSSPAAAPPEPTATRPDPDVDINELATAEPAPTTAGNAASVASKTSGLDDAPAAPPIPSPVPRSRHGELDGEGRAAGEFEPTSSAAQGHEATPDVPADQILDESENLIRDGSVLGELDGTFTGTDDEDSVLPGPHGPSSALPKPDGARPRPDFTVKADVTTQVYFSEHSPRFDEVTAHVWFRTDEDAERAGFRRHDKDSPTPVERYDWTTFVNDIREARKQRKLATPSAFEEPRADWAAVTASILAVGYSVDAMTPDQTHRGDLDAGLIRREPNPQKSVRQLLAEHGALLHSSPRRDARLLASRVEHASLPGDWVRDASHRADLALGQGRMLLAEEKFAEAEREFEDALIEGDPHEALQELRDLWNDRDQPKPTEGAAAGRLTRRAYYLLTTDDGDSSARVGAARILLSEAADEGSYAATLILKRLDTGDALPYEAYAEPDPDPVSAELASPAATST